MPSEDITYCAKKDCRRLSCERNPKNIRCFGIPHSYALLENTVYCPKSDSEKGTKDDGKPENG